MSAVVSHAWLSRVKSAWAIDTVLRAMTESALAER